MSDLYAIATSGMALQRERMDAIAENLAHAGVVRSDGSVFSPKDALPETDTSFSSQLELAAGGWAQPDFDAPRLDEFDSIASTGVDGGTSIAARVVNVPRTPQLHYEPGNPFAATGGAHKGYVATPDVDPISQMIGLVSAGRAYDADVSMLQTAKQMDLEAADIARG